MMDEKKIEELRSYYDNTDTSPQMMDANLVVPEWGVNVVTKRRRSVTTTWFEDERQARSWARECLCLGKDVRLWRRDVTYSAPWPIEEEEDRDDA